MKKYTILILFLLTVANATAQEPEPKKQPFILKGLYWVKTLIDSSAVHGVDRTYIEQPKRPWAAEVRTDASQTTLKMHTDLEFEGGATAKMSSSTTNGFATSLGAWLGYRGYGFGWSKELTGGDGIRRSLSIISTIMVSNIKNVSRMNSTTRSRSVPSLSMVIISSIVSTFLMRRPMTSR